MMELLFGIQIMQTQTQQKETPGNTKTNFIIYGHIVCEALL